MTCACNEGYVGNGLVRGKQARCKNINECKTGVAECAEGAKCSDTDGSYTCTCPKGQEGDGKTCSDIDECASGDNNCDVNATCNNVPMSQDKVGC